MRKEKYYKNEGVFQLHLRLKLFLRDSKSQFCGKWKKIMLKTLCKFRRFLEFERRIRPVILKTQCWKKQLLLGSRVLGRSLQLHAFSRNQLNLRNFPVFTQQ